MNSKLLQIFILLAVIMLYDTETAHASEDYQYALALMQERKEYKNAANKFQEFIKNNPADIHAPKALYYMASCFAKLGKDSSAANNYEKIITLYPETDKKLLSEACAYGADAYFRAKLYQKAVALYNQIIQKYPDSELLKTALYWSAEAYNRLALTGNEQDKNASYTKAINAYRLLIEKFPESRFTNDALLSAGLLAFNIKDYTTTIDFLSQYQEHNLSLEPKKEELILYHNAESFYWLKKYELAKSNFSTLLQKYPDSQYNAECHAGIGWCEYSTDNKLAAAKNFAAAALKYTNPTQALNSHFDAGVAYEEAGILNQAVTEYRYLITPQAHEKKQRAMLRLSIILKELADTENIAEAENLLHQAFNYPAENANEDVTYEAGTLLAEILLDKQEYTKASNIFSTIATENSKKEYAPYALYQLALTQAKLQHYTEASTAIKVLLKKYPTSPLRLQAAYAIADYQNALGEKEKSRIAYKWLASQSQKWAEQYLLTNKVDDPDKFTAEALEIAAAALLRLSESLYSQKDNPQAQSQAKDYFTNYITRFPDNPRVSAALLRLGELTEKDNPKIAHKYFLNALKSIDSLAGKITLDQELANIQMHVKYRLCLNDIILAQNSTDQTQNKKYLSSAVQNITEFINTYSQTENAEKLLTQITYYKAEAEYALGQKNAALQNYVTSYTTDRDSATADAALFSSACIEQENGNDNVAAEKLQTLLSYYKNSNYRSNALFILALHNRKQGNFTTAIEYIQQILKDHAASDFFEPAQLEEAKILLATEQYDQAENKLLKFIKNYPESREYPNALYTLSITYWSQVTQNTNENSIKNNLLYTKIEKTLTELINDYPDYKNNLIAKLRLGEIAYENKQYLEAQKWYQAALADPDHRLADKAHYRLAWCYLKLANSNQELLSKALAEFMEICSNYPESDLLAESALRAAKLERQNKNYQAALQLYQTADEKSNNQIIKTGALYGKGVTLLQLENYSNAFKTFKEFLANNPTSPLLHEANWGAGQAALMLGASADASDYFNAAKADNYTGKAAAKARFGLGIIAMEQNEFQLAREEFRKVDVFHSQWQEIAAASLLKAAEASIKLGESEPAKNDLKRIIEIYAATSSAQPAEKMLLTEGK